MPKVSIIVPVYNTEKYLDKCLTSLANQTLQDIQVIIINDGSTDGSQKIINQFCEKYTGKFICFNKENGGLSSARNFGINFAVGEYIGFVDSDDYVSTNCFEKMYLKAKENDADLVECDFNWIFDSKIKQDKGKDLNSKEAVFLDARVLVCNKLFKKEIIKDNNILFPIDLNYEDIEFFYKVFPFVNKYSILNESLYFYIQRESSIINNQDEKCADIFKILKNILDYYKYNKIYDKYQTELEYLYIRFLLGSSFLRIIKIPDEKTKEKLLIKTWQILNQTFPNWRKNKILKNSYNLKNIYYKTINKFTYKLYAKLFKLFK